MVLDRRVEVLFEEGEYEQVKREAIGRGVSAGELIREAVRRTYLVPSEERRRRAIEFLTSDDGLNITWDDAKQLIGRYVEKPAP